MAAKLSLPVTVTPSRVELGLRCYRRHVLHDVLQRARYFSASLEFGSVIHSGAAQWWRFAHIDGNVARAKAVAAVNMEWDRRFDARPEISQKDVSRELAVAMMTTYTKLAEMRGPFGMEDGEWQFVTVEDRLEVPLFGGYKLSFQTDRVVYNQTTGHLVIVDTKTAGRMDKRWERQWETSLQMKLYKAAAAKAYDFDPDNVDVVIEGVLKDVPSDIRYIPCPDWSQAILDEAIQQAIYVAKRDEMLIASEAKLPRDVSVIEDLAVNKTTVNYMSCYEYGIECPFRRLCTAEPEERVAILHAEYFEIPEEDSGY